MTVSERMLASALFIYQAEQQVQSLDQKGMNGYFK